MHMLLHHKVYKPYQTKELQKLLCITGTFQYSVPNVLVPDGGTSTPQHSKLARPSKFLKPIFVFLIPVRKTTILLIHSHTA